MLLSSMHHPAESLNLRCHVLLDNKRVQEAEATDKKNRNGKVVREEEQATHTHTVNSQSNTSDDF